MRVNYYNIDENKFETTNISKITWTNKNCTMCAMAYYGYLGAQFVYNKFNLSCGWNISHVMQKKTFAILVSYQ